MYLRQAEKTTLYDDIVEQLRGLIINGNIKPGERLPSERTLCEELGVSRAILREALKGLELMGVVQIKHGGGTFVRNDINANLLSQSLRFIPIDPEMGKTILELLETREAIESTSIRLAAMRATNDQLKSIEDEFALMKDAYCHEDWDKMSEHDVNFHLLICEASGNSILYQIEKSIQSMLLKAMETTIYIPTAGSLAIDFHEKIVAAIRKHDSELAQSLMVDHIRTVGKKVMEALEKKQMTQ